MGCDIHMHVEQKTNNHWEHVDSNAYDGRNYNLFAILANVRNGNGFAGIKTGEGFNPIAMPKGLPSDVSAAVQSESDSWDCDGHSHSWLTLEEILNFDWTQKTQLQGWVDAKTFKQWDGYWREQGESPRGYSGDVGGGLVQKISEEKMRELLKELPPESLQHHYCLCKWEMKYSRCASEFWVNAIPLLLSLGEPANVRIVFWFDN